MIEAGFQCSWNVNQYNEIRSCCILINREIIIFKSSNWLVHSTFLSFIEIRKLKLHSATLIHIPYTFSEDLSFSVCVWLRDFSIINHTFQWVIQYVILFEGLLYVKPRTSFFKIRRLFYFKKKYYLKLVLKF